ncbi:EamA family transporter [Umezakia ovalisporum]|uniref:EamA family transporter n=1 Tax=Umezakia ovalisporum FSS-62 TaxID=2971776 RepID=A0AA43KG01_9CYAN|nr:EamA family transporter [Umezakia ovalisporum]MDH6064575.1 EamA family transporter [Umezakia ovalisporum FSS-62]MDH6104078.1 EamA family transporter [Umezakia ovalisporum ANA283AFssAo]
MGRFEKRPDNPRVRGELSRAAETALWAVVEDLERLQQNVLRSLQEEIKRLQAEKNRLSDEIQQLLEEKEHLQQVRQITGQQVLIRQLSEALAKHISSQLQSSLASLVNKSVESNFQERSAINSPGGNNENAQQMLGSLDDTLTITFNSLQQELKNYQNNLSQQLSRMQSQQHQGEAIVEEFINHLRGELGKTKQEISQATVTTSPPTILQTTEQQPPRSSQTHLQLGEIKASVTESISTSTEDLSKSNNIASSTLVSSAEKITLLASEPIPVLSRELSESQTKSPEKPPVATEPVSVLSRELSPPKAKPLNSNLATKPETKPALSPSPKSPTFSPIQIGFLLVVLSTVVSSLYNIVVKWIFYKPYDNFGVLEIQGIISPTLGNVLLILMLRLLVVVPLMLLLAPMMHPQVWEDMQNLLATSRGNHTANSNLKQQKTLQLSLASGCFLFLSQVLIYLAIGQLATGIAIALFFVYPMIGGLLSWLLFGDRPQGFHSATLAAIFCGGLLVLGSSPNLGLANFSMGSSIAILAGVAFACYVILTRICGSQLHPVSLTLINFTTMLVLSFICLMVPLPSNLSLALQQSNLLELILSAFILGVLTLVGYVFNNVGIRKLGAFRAAIIGGGVPILTVVFAGLILQETLTIMQIMGVLFVTFGVAAYSFEKMRTQVKSSNSHN